MGLLQAVLGPRFSGDPNKWIDEMMKWENDIEHYRALSG